MKKALILIILSLVIILFLVRECRLPSPVLEPTIVTVYDTVRDTVDKFVPRYIPKPYTIVQTDTLWELLNVDTSAILRDYFSTVFYRDTILSDSTAFIVVMDSIYMNRIKARDISFKLYSQAINTTTTITEPEKLRNKIFLGLGVGGTPTSFGFTVDVMLINKKDNAYALSYNVLTKDIKFSMYWKIKL